MSHSRSRLTYEGLEDLSAGLSLLSRDEWEEILRKNGSLEPTELLWESYCRNRFNFVLLSPAGRALAEVAFAKGTSVNAKARKFNMKAKTS
jgi:hypothetical protein